MLCPFRKNVTFLLLVIFISAISSTVLSPRVFFSVTSIFHLGCFKDTHFQLHPADPRPLSLPPTPSISIGFPQASILTSPQSYASSTISISFSSSSSPTHHSVFHIGASGVFLPLKLTVFPGQTPLFVAISCFAITSPVQTSPRLKWTSLQNSFVLHDLNSGQQKYVLFLTYVFIPLQQIYYVLIYE